MCLSFSDEAYVGYRFHVSRQDGPGSAYPPVGVGHMVFELLVESALLVGKMLLSFCQLRLRVFFFFLA